MPLRSRELLLAGMGGLLALGLVAGCQTRSLQNDGLAPPPVAMGLPRSAAMSPVAAADAPPALVSLAPVAGARSVSSEQDNTSVQASSWRFADHFDNDGNGPGMLLPPRGALNQVAGTEVTPGSSASGRACTTNHHNGTEHAPADNRRASAVAHAGAPSDGSKSNSDFRASFGSGNSDRQWASVWSARPAA